jgi:hypothetical protein
MSGLLYALTQPVEGEEAKYHRWYDQEHIPDRLNVAGFNSARRYLAADGSGIYGAMYELSSPEVLRLHAYRAVKLQRTPEEEAILGQLPLVSWRVYRGVGDPAVFDDGFGGDAPWVLMTGLTPQPGTEDDVRDWQRMEFLPLLSGVPGCLRARCFEQLEGDGPSHAVVVDLATLAAATSPEMRALQATPWARSLEQAAAAAEWVPLARLRNFSGQRWRTEGILGP